MAGLVFAACVLLLSVLGAEVSSTTTYAGTPIYAATPTTRTTETYTNTPTTITTATTPTTGTTETYTNTPTTITTATTPTTGTTETYTNTPTTTTTYTTTTTAITQTNATTPTTPNPNKPPRNCKEVPPGPGRKVVVLADGNKVLCDTGTDGGGWLVFQRRTSAAGNFYRPWADYKNGFGNIRGNFWWGNEKLHLQTFQVPHELRVDFTYKGIRWFSTYPSFKIFGEADGYKLSVTGLVSGNVDDSFIQHNGMKFTTKDRDNDRHSRVNCAQYSKGAWWYTACHTSNLNGMWGSIKYGEGVNWNTKTGYYKSATSTEMKIRPLD